MGGYRGMSGYWNELQGSKYTFNGYEGYFEQILVKIAPVVHFTIDQYLLTGAILRKVGANRP